MWNLKRAMPYKELEKTLSASGRRGQAEVVKARVTGTVGDGLTHLEEWGTYKFLLRVTPDGDETPFEVSLHMRLPGNVSGSPGTKFPVLFDPNSHGFMIVDPSIVPRTKEELLTARNFAPGLPDTGSALAALGARTAPTDMAEALRYARLGQKLMASGVDAPAMINTFAPGGKESSGGAIDMVFEVTITPPDGDPYAATIRQPMLPTALDGLSSGHAISVRYDPDDPTAALIYHW